MTENTKVTFIIPTIGRDTLKNTVNCLLNQTNPNWKAIIIFDNIEPNITIYDDRIEIIVSPKLGESENSAANVRNYGISFVKTEWVAFVDDDDGIKNNYVDIFLHEVLNYTNDVIIFRMLSPYWDVLPKNNSDNFYISGVGISFACKKQIFDSGIMFTPSICEDFYFLDKVRTEKFKMMISPYLLYFVRKYDIDNINIISNRVFINE
jgi:glycosyltransferase involved in cell wall biosynthesis